MNLSGEEKRDVRRVLSNVVSLALVNGVWLLSPLVLIPYILRVIGTEGYGLYIFAWTIIGYFVIVVNYGYDFYATKEISRSRDDIDKVSSLFCEVSVSRILFAIISVAVAVVMVFFVPAFEIHRHMILLGMGVFIGQSIHPTWLFQGMEEMKFITVVTLVTRIIPIILVFVFVKGPDDAGYVMLFQSIGYLTGGVLSSVVAVTRYRLRVSMPSVADVWGRIKASWYLFLTTVGTTLYRETNVVILGFVTGNYTMVGVYSVADKFIRLFQMCVTPVVQALFPYFGARFGKSASAARSLDKVAMVLSVFLVMLALFVLLFADWMLELYMGYPSLEAARDLRIMSLILFVSGFSYLYGIAGLVNIGREKMMTLFVLSAGIVNIALCLGFAYWLGDMGASIAITAAETILCIAVMTGFRKVVVKNEEIC